jgi:hypothetical protein
MSLPASASKPPPLRLPHNLPKWTAVFPVLEWLAAASLTIALIVLHIARAHYAGPPWRDEISTVAVAESASLRQMYHQTAYDSFPLLSALLIHLWRAFPGGGSIAGLRAYGMVVGLTLVAAFWRNAWRFGRCPPLLSLSLFALNPDVIHWGDSLRAYGLASVLAVLTFGWVWDLIRREEIHAASVCLVVIGFLLSVQCMYQSSTLILANCAAAAAITLPRKRWKQLAAVALAGAIAALSMLIYAPLVRGAMGAVQDVNDVPYQYRHVFQTGLDTLSAAGQEVPWMWAGVVGFCVIALLWRSREGIRGISRALKISSPPAPADDLALYACTMLLCSVLFYGAFLMWLRLTHFAWHYIPLYAVCCACFDATRAMLGRFDSASPALRPVSRRNIVAMPTVAIAIVVAIFSLTPIWQQIRQRQTNIDQVARIIERQERPGDVILAVPFYYASTFKRYYTGPNDVVTLPSMQVATFQNVYPLADAMRNPNAIAPTLDRLDRALRTGCRVWLFEPLPFLPPGRVPRILPPPPLPASGWYCGPYGVQWQLQTGYYLENHAKNLEAIHVPATQPIDSVEAVKEIDLLDGYRAAGN